MKVTRDYFRCPVLECALRCFLRHDCLLRSSDSVSLDSIKFDKTRARTCGTWTRKIPEIPVTVELFPVLVIGLCCATLVGDGA